MNRSGFYDGIKGRGQINLRHGSYEIAVYGTKQMDFAYKITIEQIPLFDKRGNPKPTSSELPTTLVPFEQREVLEGIGQALVDLGIMKDHGTDQELKATKFHLEDMRTLVFSKPQNQINISGSHET